MCVCVRVCGVCECVCRAGVLRLRQYALNHVLHSRPHLLNHVLHSAFDRMPSPMHALALDRMLHPTSCPPPSTEYTHSYASHRMHDARVYVYVYVYLCMRMRICMCMCVWAALQLYLYVCMFVFVYIYVYTCTYVYVCRVDHERTLRFYRS